MAMYLGSDDQGTNEFTLQDFEPSSGSKMHAAIREAWLESYGPVAIDWYKTNAGAGDQPKLSGDAATAMAKAAGVALKGMPHGKYTEGQLQSLIERQTELKAIKDVRERTPWDMGSIARGGAMFGAGILDPINVATTFLPWTKTITALRGVQAATAGGTLASRTMARAAIGGADAGISTAVLEPLYYGARQQIGDEYGALDSMANIAFGTAFGGGLHAIGGAGADAFRAMRGRGAEATTPDFNPATDAPEPIRGTVAGGETQIRVGDVYEPARWAVIDADELQATVGKADNQFRDRSRAAYQAEIQQRANNIDFNLLAESPLMDVGAPTLSKDGRIIGGNGRALFISKAYEIGKGGDYRGPMEARLAEFGIDPEQAKGMNKPVLVRVLQRDVDVRKAAMASNEGGSTVMSPLEQAKVDAERMGDTRLQVSADGGLDSAQNAAAIRKWVNEQPENTRNGLMDDDGKLSASGMQRLNSALLFKAYGDSPVLGRLIESIDPGSRNIAQALGRTAPTLANARASIDAGDLHPLDIAADIQQAVEKFNALRDQGMTVPDYLSQLDAFGDGLTPEATRILEFIGENVRSPRRMADLINGFYEQLDAAGSPKQSDMFGDAAAPDKLGMLDQAARNASASPDTAVEVMQSVSPETREATVRTAVSQAVSGREVDVEAIVGLDPSRNTATIDDVVAAGERNRSPQESPLADFEVSAEVDARNKSAPDWNKPAEASRLADEASESLRELLDAGDEAFKYSQGGVGSGDVPTVETLHQALRKSFGESTDKLFDAGRITVVADVDGIPGGPHPGDVKAATLPDGRVFVVAKNVTVDEARGMMLHEVGVHVGMERMLGADLFNGVLTQLDDAIARGESWATAARNAVPADTPAGLVREEQLAYLVQHSPELPFVKRMIAAIREWVYRNFEFAREHMTLTDDDFRALAVSALHDAARRGADADGSPLRYSRGETLDAKTATLAEEQVYKDRVARAKQYAGVLRAAAEKLDSDADATQAMRAALPDITPQEIGELLTQLRQQVKGLRGVARDVNARITAADVADVMQPEAMKAADDLANNIVMAAEIAQRNASLNLAVRHRLMGFMGQFRKNGLNFEGMRAVLVGSQRVRAGARQSVELEQKQFRGKWLGGLTADLEASGMMQHFTSGNFDRDIYVAMYDLGKGRDVSNLPEEAVTMAKIIEKYQADARNTRNRFGAWIRDLNGYITRQSHDMLKIRDAGERAFIEYTLPRLDLRASMRDFQGTADDFLRRVYDDFASGSHMKTPTDELDLQVPNTGGGNIAKKVSASRVLYFKDGAAAFEYNQKFGSGRLAESVLSGLDQSAKSAGLMKTLGTNPEAMLNRVFEEYADTLRGDPKARNEFMQHRKELQNLLATVDGSMNIPGNATAARVLAFVRSLVSMAKLGGMSLSAITDLNNNAAELRFGQGKNLLSGSMESINGMLKGRADGEKYAILNQLGVFHEAAMGAALARFDTTDLMGGTTAAAMQTFFKLSGINWWTETIKDAYALSHSNYLASNAKLKFAALPEALRDMLGLYNINEGKWDLLRMVPLQAADGRSYMTPEGLQTVPDAALENYMVQVGRTPSAAGIANLREDLASALRSMTIDRMNHAVIEPDARARAFMLRGTQPGTVPGEILRMVSQFKSFPVAMVQRILGREVYGRGYDTIGDYIKNGKGDMVGLATFIGMSAVFGYAAMSAKDLIKGRNPRPADDPRTWAAALIQGGGLGIYGDFLFGKFDRMGNTFIGTMAGPVAGLANTVFDLWNRFKGLGGDGDHKARDFGAALFGAAVNNTPFLNLFWARWALDYIILYSVQEWLNPGFLRRMERRIERENGQTFFMPPSQNANRL